MANYFDATEGQYLVSPSDYKHFKSVLSGAHHMLRNTVLIHSYIQLFVIMFIYLFSNKSLVLVLIVFNSSCHGEL